MELYEQVDRRTDIAQARDMRTLGRLWMPVPKPLPLRQVIRATLLNALAYTAGDQQQAAICLAISPRVMGFQMANHGIPLSTDGLGRTRRRSPNGVRRPRKQLSTLDIPSVRPRGRQAIAHDKAAVRIPQCRGVS